MVQRAIHRKGVLAMGSCLRTVAENRGTTRRTKLGNTRYRRNAGQSLIEVLASLFILSVGMLPVVSLTLDSGRISKQAELRSVAYAAARQQMERLRALRFDSRTAGSAPAAADFAVSAATQTQFPQAHLQGNYVVVPLSSTLQQVTVQISWRNPAAKFRQNSSIRLSTLIAKEPGL
jgi:Tfp pilus assembly protein PilX